MHEKRHTQDTAMNWPSRRLGDAVIHYCIECPALMIWSCLHTGERIADPRRGPFGKECILPVNSGPDLDRMSGQERLGALCAAADRCGVLD